jgi:hypothetical protein
MISAGELARRAGVKKQAITYQVKKGLLPRVVSPEGKQGFNETDPRILDYIAHASSQRATAHGTVVAPAENLGVNEAQPPAPSSPPPKKTRKSAAAAAPVAPPADSDDEDDDELGAGLDYLEKGDLDRAKVREQIIKARIDNNVARGKYLPREDVKRVFGRVYSVHTSILRPLSSKLGPDLAALFGNTDPALTLRAIQAIDAEVYRALGMIQRRLIDYLDAAGAGTLPGAEIPDEPELPLEPPA